MSEFTQSLAQMIASARPKYGGGGAGAVHFGNLVNIKPGYGYIGEALGKGVGEGFKKQYDFWHDPVELARRAKETQKAFEVMKPAERKVVLRDMNVQKAFKRYRKVLPGMFIPADVKWGKGYEGLLDFTEPETTTREKEALDVRIGRAQATGLEWEGKLREIEARVKDPMLKAEMGAILEGIEASKSQRGMAERGMKLEEEAAPGKKALTEEQVKTEQMTRKVMAAQIKSYAGQAKKYLSDISEDISDAARKDRVQEIKEIQDALTARQKRQEELIDQYKYDLMAMDPTEFALKSLKATISVVNGINAIPTSMPTPDGQFVVYPTILDSQAGMYWAGISIGDAYDAAAVIMETPPALLRPEDVKKLRDLWNGVKTLCNSTYVRAEQVWDMNIPELYNQVAAVHRQVLWMDYWVNFVATAPPEDELAREAWTQRRVVIERDLGAEPPKPKKSFFGSRLRHAWGVIAGGE